MSMWTHITGSIFGDCIYDFNIKNKKLMEKKLNKLKNRIENEAPKITGSEQNADIFINVSSGYNMHTNSDCNVCKHSKHIGDGEFVCDGCDSSKCVDGYYQSEITITISGDLRDRCKEETQQEADKFFNWIESNIITQVRAKSCCIKGE